MNRGYIKLYRKIQDNSLFDEPANRMSAWIDLLLMANHKDKSFVMGMKKINVKRGQKWTSLGKLAERWKWNRKTVKGYLKLLENEGMIYLEITNRGLLISVVNYSKFQDFLDQGGQQNGHLNGHQNGHQRDIKTDIRTDTKTDTNNNVNNDNKNDIKNDSKMNKKPSAFFVRGGVVYEE